MIRATDDLTLARFVERLAEHGVLVHPGGCNVCGVLTTADALQTALAIEAACADLRAGVPLRGQPFQRAIWRNTASVEAMST